MSAARCFISTLQGPDTMRHPAPFVFLAVSASIAGVAAIASAPGITAPTEPVATTDHSAECVESHAVSALFAPGTDPEIVEQVSLAIQGLGIDRFQTTNRWPGAANEPVTITYSFPSDGINIPSGVGEGAGTNVHTARMNTLFGSEPVWKAIYAEVFAEWAAITGNTYIEVADDDAPMFNSPGPLHGGAGRGDVRIVAKNIDGSGGTLAYNFFPGVDGGDMVMDSGENWGDPSNDFRFFRNTIAHEHGHGQGILHVCPVTNGKLMEPFLNTNFSGPQHDDIRAGTFHYGDFYEPNNTTGDATFIGSFSDTGAFAATNLAIRDAGDDDYFSFETTGPGTLDVTADPFGFSYESEPQTFFCFGGPPDNSNNEVDLRIDVYEGDGVTLVASVNDAGFGVAESLSGVVLDAAGTYYVRVHDAAVDDGDQIYDLDIAVTVEAVASCIGDINGDGVTDTADLGILIAAFGDHGAGLPADLNGDMAVDTADLGILISVFGGCTE